MSDLTIDIHVPGNQILKNTVVPDDFLTEQVITELIDELNLPRATQDGQVLKYVLFSPKYGKNLLSGRSLPFNGVQTGDTLHLELAGIEKFDDGVVDVILSVLDKNRNERVSLGLDSKIGDIISKIVHLYDLPTRGTFNEPVTYHLTSKALGIRLDRSITLRQQRIPLLDRLTLTREEVAGGGMRLKVDVGASGMLVETKTFDEYKVGEVIQDLVTRLGLQRIADGGEVIRYALLHGADLSNLPKRKTLKAAGVRNGDTIWLVSDHQPSNDRTKERGTRPEPGRRFEQSAFRAGPCSSSKPRQPVKCTVFAPPAVRQGSSFLVQVFTHLLDQADEANAAAKEFDNETERRGTGILGIDVEHGATLTFHLLAPEFEVDSPVQQLVWRGLPESVQFGLQVSKDQWLGDFVATVRVSYDQIPIGHIKFKIEVVGFEESTQHSGLVGEASVYRKAFVSYASQDRVEVLKRVQMLARLRIDVFQDILSLEPGDRWERILYRHIDDSDLFLLFWSTAAKNSQWVMKEVKYALWLKKGDDHAPPEIIPIIIEGPPIVPPPDELAHLHFNDRFLYYISGSQVDAS